MGKMASDQTQRPGLWLVADEKNSEGVTSNKKVYQVAELMAAHRYQRTIKMCREKPKKLSDYYNVIVTWCWKTFGPHEGGTQLENDPNQVEVSSAKTG